MRGYAICTAPRSGSNFLCQLLASTGKLGQPLEYFNGPGRRYFDWPDYPDDPEQQVQQVLRRGATGDVYGFKIFAHQHDWISLTLRWTEKLPNLQFVFLRRRDLLGQGISWARGVQTRQYRHTQPVAAEPAFDPDQIADRLRAIPIEYARWEVFFAGNGIDPLRLVYEDVVQFPQRSVDAVGSLFGLEGQVEPDLSKVDVRVQRDGLSENWRERFIAERGSPDVLPLL